MYETIRVDRLSFRTAQFIVGPCLHPLGVLARLDDLPHNPVCRWGIVDVICQRHLNIGGVSLGDHGHVPHQH
jgi:hypothetical protein